MSLMSTGFREEDKTDIRNLTDYELSKTIKVTKHPITGKWIVHSDLMPDVISHSFEVPEDAWDFRTTVLRNLMTIREYCMYTKKDSIQYLTEEDYKHIALFHR